MGGEITKTEQMYGNVMSESEQDRGKVDRAG